MNCRVKWLDSARGIAVFLVILGHMGIPYFGKYITSFHMPLFFFLSGVTFSVKDSFSEFVRKKAMRLLVPYFCLGIPCIISSYISRAAEGTLTAQAFIQVLLKFIVQKRMYTLWFLTCLFLLQIIFFVLVKLCKEKTMWVAVSSVFLGAVGICYYAAGGSALPWNVDICMTACPWFMLGWVCKKYGCFDKVDFWKSWGLALLALFSNLAAVTINWVFFNSVFNMALNSYGFVPVSIAAILSGIYCVVFFSKRISTRFFAYFGRNSMVYFAWHQSIAIPLILYFVNQIPFFAQDTLVSDVLRTIVVSAAVVVVLYPFDRLTQMEKGKFLVGR